MKQSNINKIWIGLFFLYAIWNYMIYIAIDHAWESFIGWHWFVGSMMLIFSGVIFITFFFNEYDDTSEQEKEQ